MNSATNLISSSPLPSFLSPAQLSAAPPHQRFGYSIPPPPYPLPPLFLNREVSLPVTHSSDEDDISPRSTPSYSNIIPAAPVGATPSASPAPLHHFGPGSTGSDTVPSVVLTDKELWRSFHAVGNEMIVTKPGRRLFPVVLVTVKGLNPSVKYTIKVRFVSADKYRHKFLTGRWTAVGESDIMQDETRMAYSHPTSPNTGEYWMKKPISFKCIKVTHHSESKNGNILLHTMHKYRIEIVIKTHQNFTPDMVFPLHYSEFIAVTSYQSSSITKLKVDNNPFAKGFRDQDMMTQAATYHPPPSILPPFNPLFSAPPYFPPIWATNFISTAPPIPSIHSLISANHTASLEGDSEPSSTASSPLTPNEL